MVTNNPDVDKPAKVQSLCAEMRHDVQQYPIGLPVLLVVMAVGLLNFAWSLEGNGILPKRASAKTWPLKKSVKHKLNNNVDSIEYFLSIGD